ncbi:hypothetical protein CRUP_002586 [Coryphaenoides rupestris]|nr:hypothetical protein CRUP_002586 [Coryphaenoides rupestris]
MSAGRVNVKQEEIDEMLKEAPGPINFTVFLTMFGEKQDVAGNLDYKNLVHVITHGEEKDQDSPLLSLPPFLSPPLSGPSYILCAAYLKSDQ